MDETIEKILKTRSKAELEELGGSLNLEQIHKILDFIHQKDKETVEKLMPLLVGMSSNTFYGLLSEITQTELELLKEIGPTEALQHKLTLFLHDWKLNLDKFSTIFEEIKKEIEDLSLENLHKKEIFSIKGKIDTLGDQIEDGVHTLNNALLIAWNTKRVDLIENLSHLKDQFLRLNASYVGNPKYNDQVSSGLYKILEEKLDQVYSLKESKEKLLLLSGNVPAIEALATLGIFYLEDYWKLGLFSEIPTLKELRQILRKKNHEEKSLFLEELMDKAEKKLKTLGLTNVDSLKEANIFSKNMLSEYIQKF